MSDTDLNNPTIKKLIKDVAAIDTYEKPAEESKTGAASISIADTSELNLRIGMMRQWLNEDRITDPDKMITNEDIHHWLDVGIDTEIAKAKIDELEMFASSYLTDAGHKYLTKRYKQLRGEEK